MSSHLASDWRKRSGLLGSDDNDDDGEVEESVSRHKVMLTRMLYA